MSASTFPSAGRPGRAIVVGGSLGGLFAATLLDAAGWSVDVYERSPHELESRGGGLVLQPEALDAFRRAGVEHDASIGVTAHERIFLARDGAIAHRVAARQTQTSWSSLYGALRRRLAPDRYHLGAELIGFEQDADRVVARLRMIEGRRTVERDVAADLLIGADGRGSAVRGIVSPSVEPTYAGYIAWRGIVDEAVLPPEATETLSGRFAFFEYPNAHILGYLIPGADDAVEPGRRRYNWVWYRNEAEDHLAERLTDRDGRVRQASLPPGAMPEATRRSLVEAAARFLPPQFRLAIEATREPFIQTIADLEVPRMAFGRVALIGDAAFIVRPHTAAGTSKAAGDALALVDALAAEPSVPEALTQWEPERLLFGRRIAEHGRRLGERSQNSFPTNTPT